jgi:DNA-binding NarL/FixJ family response regulator
MTERGTPVTVSVLVVDDHRVFAQTLAAALGAAPELDVAGVAASGSEALDLAAMTKPDVALIDLGLPDVGGVELARRLRDDSPATRVVVLTASQDIAFFTAAMEAGVSGYLTKQSDFTEVIDAIIAAHDGRVVVPASVMEQLLAARAPTEGLGSDLTPRELEVLALLGRGYDAKRVASTLGISWHTSRSYTKNILTKLQAHSALEAVSKATRLGIVTHDGQA